MSHAFDTVSIHSAISSPLPWLPITQFGLPFWVGYTPRWILGLLTFLAVPSCKSFGTSTEIGATCTCCTCSSTFARVLEAKICYEYKQMVKTVWIITDPVFNLLKQVLTVPLSTSITRFCAPFINFWKTPISSVLTHKWTQNMITNWYLKRCSIHHSYSRYWTGSRFQWRLLQWNMLEILACKMISLLKPRPG